MGGPNAPIIEAIIDVCRGLESGSANDMTALLATPAYFDIIGSCGHVRRNRNVLPNTGIILERFITAVFRVVHDVDEAGLREPNRNRRV